MDIFLSYPSEERELAEEIQLALTGSGHSVFIDSAALQGGADYHARIRAAIRDADAFVFLITSQALQHGRYTLSELACAKERWPHPRGHVVPVLVRPTPLETVPPYLKSVTIVQPQGNLPADVLAAVSRLGGGGRIRRPLVAAAAVAVAALVAGGAWLAGRDAPAAAGAPEAELRLPNPLQMRFDYVAPAAAAASAAELKLRVDVQVNRRIFSGEQIVRQDGGWYGYNTAFPDDGETLAGTLARQLRFDETRLGAPPAPSTFCLKRPRPLKPFDDGYVHLDCRDGAACTVHAPSPLWLESCFPPAQRSAALGFIAAAHAAEPPQRAWSVPSLRTLEASRDRIHGVGYTVFTVETGALNDPKTIGVEVDIRVNGHPVYEDGLAPAQRPVAHAPGQPFRYAFAFESLDFAGAQAGCEGIALTLRPRLADGRGGAPAAALLPYVALRDTAPTAVPVAGGTLTWQARYVVPAGEWSHEAFVTSVVYPAAGGDAAQAAARERTAALKARFDALGLRHDGRPVVAVIRPPLTRRGDLLAYGLAAGTVQTSGQVRFTFSADGADRLAKTLLAARAADAAARRAIEAAPYVYKVAGNADRAATPTPDGVCAHVRGS